MTTAEQISQLVTDLKAQGKPLSGIAWTAAKACLGWAYVFGARGQLCTPSTRRSFYAKKGGKHPTIKSKCRNFDGSDKVIGDCAACKWYPGGRTRVFDCRGFTYWVLLQVFGWTLKGDGATAQWDIATNWAQKGEITTMPRDTLCCLFVRKGNVMEHTGFGLNDETIECSGTVIYTANRKSKWTHWAVPACVANPEPQPEPTPEPTPTPEESMQMIVTAPKGDTVNLRSAPSTNSSKGPVIAKVPVGSIVTRITETDKWSFVRWRDQQGYMLSEFLQPAPDDAPVPDTDERDKEIREKLEAAQALIAEALNILNAKG